MEQYFSINAEGFEIRSKLYAPDRGEIRKVVLFGHGFGGHKDNKAAERFAGYLLQKNSDVAVMTFNWPCHGDDAGTRLRLEDCSVYIRLAAAYLAARFRSPALFAYATSFGGYLFLKYISEEGNPFQRTVLRCPAVNMYGVITSSIMTEENRRQIAEGKTALVGFDRKVELDGSFLESLRQADITRRSFACYASDILILHGSQDEIVPIEAVRTFAERSGIGFKAVDGADHRFLDPEKMDLAIRSFAAFLGMESGTSPGGCAAADELK